MLYDKRWDKPEVKADPFSLKSLMEWLEKQPADDEYCFLDTGGCLFFQYLDHNGVVVASVGGNYYRAEQHGEMITLPHGWPKIAAEEPRTFGAALERARAVFRSPEATEHE